MNLGTKNYLHTPNPNLGTEEPEMVIQKHEPPSFPLMHTVDIKCHHSMHSYYACAYSHVPMITPFCMSASKLQRFRLLFSRGIEQHLHVQFRSPA